jgi:uncharacterized membrane protein
LKRLSMIIIAGMIISVSVLSAFAVDIRQSKGNVLEIPLKDLSDKAVFYTFSTAKGAKVTFFALLDNEKKPHIAFNACDVCYQARKGYTVTSEKAVCNNCKNQFATRLIGLENQSGGCWPSYIPVKVTRDKVVIAVKDVEAKAYLFPL